eukprot:GHUV01015859.1.p4 GENE.GHUV01015859.1~~GHUV01015859.1.p4  ORF type:complete len:125 (+),score=62.84 GHUV01015859.1:4365-4739(+)
MSALPASFYRKLTAEADSSSSSNKSSLSPHNDAAAAGSPQAVDDTRLLRPVDPSKPGYYWKPVQGEAAAAAVRETLGPAFNAENVLSYQVTPGHSFCYGLEVGGYVGPGQLLQQQAADCLCTSA